MKEKEPRQTYYEASVQNRFVTYKKRTVTDALIPTVDEFKKILIEKSPCFIFHDKYSSEKPCYEITKIVMPSDEGVYLTCPSWGDKTPIFHSWEEIHRAFRIQGFEYFRF